MWADGVYFNMRLEEERTCVLVVISADYVGKKHLLAVRDGFRESEQSWKELLLTSPLYSDDTRWRYGLTPL